MKTGRLGATWSRKSRRSFCVSVKAECKSFSLWDRESGGSEIWALEDPDGVTAFQRVVGLPAILLVLPLEIRVASVQKGHEPSGCQSSVLHLGSFLLGHNGEAGWKVRHAHSRFGLVDVLASGSGGTKGLDFEVTLVQNQVLGALKCLDREEPILASAMGAEWAGAGPLKRPPPA